jgi:organic radical activating enzyme
VAEALPVVETFHSLQGEGLHAGRSAFFIRLGGCRVGCSWCDTKHSWPEQAHPSQSLTAIAAAAHGAAQTGAAFVVITGGEPLHHNLDSLCATLKSQVLNRQGEPLPLHLETSGVDALSGQFAWITLSPKPHRPPCQELLAACDELKVIVHNPSDLAFAEAMATAAQQAKAQQAKAKQTENLQTRKNNTKTGSGPELLLQPGWQSAEGQSLAIDFVRQQPQWRLSLQSHKWLGVR